jgi:dUTP pyrophosphatase
VFKVVVGPDGKTPTRADDGSAGYDLFAAKAGVINPGRKECIPTDVTIELPMMNGYQTVGLIKSRSGLSYKKDMEVGAGVIDFSYRGKIGVILHNFGEEDFEYDRGDKIAQLLIMPVATPLMQQVDMTDLSDTNRGAGGFGSTGR